MEKILKLCDFKVSLGFLIAIALRAMMRNDV